ncbi:MAG: SpvB/TcaC N-terminal domain-containing protein [Gaiellaceae bacterium]
MASESAADVINLPQGGGALSGLGESFAPDPHTGTGNLTLPIALPRGRNGFQPGLDLHYSTGSGNGPFGLGWSLGIPSVSRKTARGVPLYRETDVFLLAGLEDLVPVEAGSGWTRYSPRTEGLYARIKRFETTSGDYWEVTTKDGLVSLFGARKPSGGTVSVEPKACVRDQDRVFSWQLTQTTDPFGNRIEYAYQSDEPDDAAFRTRDDANGHRWLGRLPDSIRYIDFEDAEGSERFLVTVNFDYEDRPDPFSDYRSGFEIRSTKRCTRIRTASHANKDRAQPIRTYELTYLDDRHGVAGEVLPPNRVSLLAGFAVLGHEDNSPTVLGAAVSETPQLLLDYTHFNPEKRSLSAIDGDLPAKSLAQPGYDLVDLTGDGLPDIVELNGATRYWRNRGGRFDPPRDLATTPAGVGLETGARILDANGDGRADLLVDEYRGYFPVGLEARWDDRSLRRYRRFPTIDLGASDVRLIDLDGDGLTDVLRGGSSFHCWFNDADPAQAWARERLISRRRIDEFPNVDFGDVRVHVADMNGDGLQDIVLLHDRSICYWPSHGHGTWGARVWMESPPDFEFEYTPEQILLGDVDGDGAADLLYVDGDSVTVWVNCGGNAWSDPIVIHGTPSPADADARLADLEGAGIGGVLWTRDKLSDDDASMFFLDLTGGTKPYLLREIDNNIGATTKIEYRSSSSYAIADELRGTPWLTPLPFPVQAVSRLESIDRISGGTVVSEFEYHHGYWDGHEREFRGFGRVDRRDTESFESHAAAHGEGTLSKRMYSPPVETRSWFHLGSVGLELGLTSEPDFSEEWWSGDPRLLQRPAETTAWLQTLAARQAGDALRSLRGSLIRKEVYALDGSSLEDRPYSVGETSYGILEVAGKGVGTTVFAAEVRARRATEWARGEDPMTTFSFSDSYDSFGRPRHETKVALPRRSAKRADYDVAHQGVIHADEERVLCTLVQTDWATPSPAELYVHDRVSHAVELTLEVPPKVQEQDSGNLGHVLVDQRDAAVYIRDLLLKSVEGWSAGGALPAGLDLLGHSRNRYDGTAFTGRNDGKVGPYGALTRTETLILTDGDLDSAFGTDRPSYLGGGAAIPAGAPPGFGASIGYSKRVATPSRYFSGYYADTARRRVEQRGVVTATKDPLGSETEVVFDKFDLMPAKVIDAAGLEVEVSNDFRVFQPSKHVDVNGNATRYLYTPLGLLAKTWLEGRAGEGGTEAEPEARFEYDFMAFASSREDPEPQPIYAHVSRRVQHAHAGTSQDRVEARDYSDGFGRVVQTRALGERLAVDDLGLPSTHGEPSADATGATSQQRVVVSGWRVYDNKAREVLTHESFFSKGWAFERKPDIGAAWERCYDARGQLIRMVAPDGAEERTILGVPKDLTKPDDFAPSPWESYGYDANDLGKPGAVSGSTRPAHASHRSTPSTRVLDGLGRIVAQLQRNGQAAPDTYATRSSYDLHGHVLSVLDPLGRRAIEHAYDRSGRILRTVSLDAGVRTFVPDAAGHVVQARDNRGALVLREYDRLSRPTQIWGCNRSQDPLTLRERITYGDSGQASQPASARAANRALNRLGRPSIHRDESGRVDFELYDFKGNIARKSRRLVREASLAAGWEADWSQPGSDSALETRKFQIDGSYDALDRAYEITYPLETKPRAGQTTARRSKLTARFNRSGSLEHVEVDGTVYVEHIAYSAQGQRILIECGNGLMTRYSYDPLTFRLARQRTERCQHQGTLVWHGIGQPLQDVEFAYDPVGNVVSLDERVPDCGVTGTAHGRDRLVRTFAYDPLYRLTAASGRACKGSGSPRAISDALGCGGYLPGVANPTQSNAPELTERYTETYSYDSIGNLLSLAYQAASGNWRRDFGIGDKPPDEWEKAKSNRLTSLVVSSSTTTFAFDDCGNLASQDLSQKHTWDHANRMTGFEISAGGPASIDARYVYDSSGDRVMKRVVRGAATWAAVSVDIDGIFEYHRWRENGATKEGNTLHIADGERRIALVNLGDRRADDAGPVTQYHLADHVGSSALVAGGNGSWVNREEYFPYGETSFGSFAKKRFRFNGKIRDEESGLVYFGERFYGPWMARWTSCDQMGAVDGLALYAYARGSPIVLRDEHGRQGALADQQTYRNQQKVEKAFFSSLSPQEKAMWAKAQVDQVREKFVASMTPKPGSFAELQWTLGEYSGWHNIMRMITGEDEWSHTLTLDDRIGEGVLGTAKLTSVALDAYSTASSVREAYSVPAKARASTATRAADAMEEGLVNYEAGRLGTQTHSSAGKVREAFGVPGVSPKSVHPSAPPNVAAMEGAVFESAHVVPQSVGKNIPGYNPNTAETVLMPKELHASFDDIWKPVWEDMKDGAAAGKSSTAYDVEVMLKSAIDKSNMPPQMKGTMHFMVDTELYGRLGLNRSSVVLKGKVP